MSKRTIAIDDFFEYGLDIQTRSIYFGTIENVDNSTAFNTGTVQLAMRGIDKLLAASNKPISLHFSSFGGDEYSMMALMDKILESPCKFIFYGRGAIMSSTTWIMCVCDERYLSENATVMIHDGSTDHYGSHTDQEVSTEEAIRIQRALEKIYADNSYLDAAFYKTICRRDLYLTSAETIKLGLADAIIPYKKRGQFRSGIRKQTFSNVPTKSDITKLVDRLYKRIKLDSPKNLIIDIKKDQTEVIEEYDNSTEVVKTVGKDKNNEA